MSSIFDYVAINRCDGILVRGRYINMMPYYVGSTSNHRMMVQYYIFRKIGSYKKKSVSIRNHVFL